MDRFPLCVASANLRNSAIVSTLVVSGLISLVAVALQSLQVDMSDCSYKGATGPDLRTRKLHTNHVVHV